MDLPYDAKMYQEIINQTIMNLIHILRCNIYSKFVVQLILNPNRKLWFLCMSSLISKSRFMLIKAIKEHQSQVQQSAIIRHVCKQLLNYLKVSYIKSCLPVHDCYTVKLFSFVPYIDIKYHRKILF